MLNLDLAPTFTRTATFQIPSGTGFAEQDCTVTFAALPLDEFAAFDLGKPEDVKRFLVRAVADMGELVNGQGEPVAYTPAVRDQLINQDWGRQGLVRAYIIGRQKAAEGKLRWAARAWLAGAFAQPDGEADDAVADARRWGLDDGETAAVKAALGQRDGERLWAWHATAFAALCAAGTQWRRRLVPGADGLLRELVAGLDYAGLKVAIDALGLVLSPDDFRQLRVLEAEVVRALSEAV